MQAPGTRAAATEHQPLEAGDGERLSGYGIIGQPFHAGHVLALRRFPHNSIGPGYTSVWHCDPDGTWRMWTDAPPQRTCARYFGPALSAVDECDIAVEWPDDRTVVVRVDGVLEWRTSIRSTPTTRLMTVIGSHLPASIWQNNAALDVIGRVAGPVLRADTIRLRGSAPSAQWFKAIPMYVWATDHVNATMRGESLGRPGAITPQRQLGDFRIPNRGLFFVGRVAVEAYEPDRHVLATPSTQGDASPVVGSVPREADSSDRKIGAGDR